MPTLKSGARAPAFSLSDQAGNVVSLNGFEGRKLLMYFYPKADTPGCTQQSCAVRDALSELAAAGVACVGVSPDVLEDQAQFDARFHLGFPLLADTNHAVAEAYGVWGERSMYGKTFMGITRSAFLIDERGVIVEAWYKVSPGDTIPKAKAALGLA